jgi:hypothetical protein
VECFEVAAGFRMVSRKRNNKNFDGDQPACRVPWLGSSFGTKTLYFGAYDHILDGELHPLIVDANVVRARKTPVSTVAKYAESETDVEISDEWSLFSHELLGRNETIEGRGI